MGSQQQQQQKDVVFDLDAASFSSDEFRMYQFKVCDRLHRNKHPDQHPASPGSGKAATVGDPPTLFCSLLAAGEALPSLTAA